MDRNDTQLLRTLVEVPALARRLYPRGRYEGLEPNALQVLVALQLQSDRTVGDLVEQLTLGQGTVSTALALLHERRLVHAVADESDARRQRQTITQKGTQLVERFAAETLGRMEGIQSATRRA